MNQKISKKGFTLVELLIVIAIIAVLATAVTLVLNPAELLRQARDTTRISDLNTIDSAIGLYIADVTSPTWNTSTSCTAAGTSPFVAGGTCGAGGIVVSVSTAVNGTGWVPINFAGISAGSPLPRLPIDPVNSITNFYAYKSSSSVGIYEIDAHMESTKYKSGGGDDKESNTKDGGSNDNWFEVGKTLAL